MNTSTKQKFREFLTNRGMFLEFQTLVSKKTDYSYNQYVEYVECLYVISRISHCLPEDRQQEFNELNKDWLNMVAYGAFSGSLKKYCEKYTISAVVNAIKYLIDNNLWNSPEGDESLKSHGEKEKMRKEYLADIDEAVAFLNFEKEDSVVSLDDAEQILAEEEPPIPEEDDTEIIAPEPPGTHSQVIVDNAYNTCFWKEEWRPFHNIQPIVSDKNHRYIVLANFIGNDGKKREMVRMAHWNGLNFHWGRNADGPHIIEDVIAWVPYPCKTLIMENPIIQFPIEIHYAQLVKAYQDVYSRENKHSKYIGRLKDKLATITEEADVQKQKATKAIEVGKQFSEKYDSTLAQLNTANETIATLKAEIEALKSKTPDKVIIPLSQMLEYPFVGRRTIDNLKPFFERYNVFVDDKK